MEERIKAAKWHIKNLSHYEAMSGEDVGEELHFWLEELKKLQEQH